MVDVNVSNYKLKERAKNIVATITNISVEAAGVVLEQAHLEVKPAIVMVKTSVGYNKAKQLIDQANGFFRQAIEFD